MSELDEGLAEAGGAPAADVEIIPVTPEAKDYLPELEIEAACNGNITCSGVTSCTNWSSIYACDGGACRLTTSCGECLPPEPLAKGDVTADFCTREPGFFQNNERFRVCFYNDGSQCLEFQQFAFLEFCGC